MRAIKRGVLNAVCGAGGFRWLARSQWRRRRLLVLCYHGISLDDEHEWDPALFMPVALFRARMEQLRQEGCTVLGLDEAVRRLAAGDLPERSVAITFDDGMHNFQTKAWPVLQEYRYPATLYLTTYYSEYNRPIYRLACNYMMWKHRENVVENVRTAWWQGSMDLRSGEVRAEVIQRIERYATENALSGRQRDDLAAELAAVTGFDYEELVRRRLMQLATPEEVGQMAREGLDIQLHTHRHRTPLDRTLFLRELDDNRRRIREWAGQEPSHFCYPSGAYREEFFPWLREFGVKSATTCVPGIAEPGGDVLTMPRLVDHCHLSELDIASWLTGFASVLPRRRYDPLPAAP